VIVFENLTTASDLHFLLVTTSSAQSAGAILVHHIKAAPASIISAIL
jgi:hypothetical protein